MKIYMAGAPKFTQKQRATGELPNWFQNISRILFSYFYCNDGQRPDFNVEMSAKHHEDLFLDSGAFTAFTKGVKITCEEFAEFIHNCSPDMWETISSLDVVGTGEEAARASYENLKELERLGCKVQPVFHMREPEEYLKRYVDEGYDYIFIGGAVVEESDYMTFRLNELFSKYLCDERGYPRVKTHGFGITMQDIMFSYPWHSVDSSTWHKAAVYGACTFMIGGKVQRITFTEESPHKRQLNAPHIDTLPPAMRKQVLGWLEEFGTTRERVSKSTDERAAVNALVYKQLESRGVDRLVLNQPTLFC